MVEEREFGSGRLPEVIIRVLSDRDRLSSMSRAMQQFARPQAAARIVDRLLELAR
jgi:UDP-N-acetylglucosamine:LPS N-acetylglucosamine transferase